MPDEVGQKPKLSVNPFENISANFVRNPLGIIALFIVLVYAMAAFVAASASGLTVFNQTVLILFLVLFPVLVLGVFYRLVTKHAPALYGPADLGAENFLAVHKVAPEKATQTKRFERWLQTDTANRPKLDAWIKQRGLNMSLTSFIYNSNLAEMQQQAFEELKIPEVQ